MILETSVQALFLVPVVILRVINATVDPRDQA